MWDRPQALLWVANFLYALAAVMLLYGTIYVVVHLPIFPLKEVRVDGELHHVNREQIKFIVKRHLQGNFFTLDLEKARDAFQKLPWARKVSIRRRWPDRLDVSIEEHQALARWGNIALVNTYGELFHAASDSELPVFYGPGDGVYEVALHYASYSGLLEPIQKKIVQIGLSPRRAWQLKTEDGVQVEMGREDMESRLQRFVEVYPNSIGKLGSSVKVAYVDLRYPNGFAVRKPVVNEKPNVKTAVIPSSKELAPIKPATGKTPSNSNGKQEHSETKGLGNKTKAVNTPTSEGENVHA